MSAGAYGFSMSSTYNSRPRVAEVMVNGTKFALVRKRETYADLLRGRIDSGVYPVKIPFTKMHGTGNDFIVVDCRAFELPDPAAFSISIAT